MTSLRPDLLPTPAEIVRLREVAAGRAPGDLVVRGGLVLSVHTSEFLPRDVVIAGSHIAAVTEVGRMSAPEEIDATGTHVVPNFVDAHFHIEYSMLTPGQLARLSVPRGTTTVLHDPDCMANVSGLAGMDFMKTTSAPLRIFEQVSPTTPGNPLLERGGAEIPDAAVIARMAAAESVSLGESNPFDFSPQSADRYAAALVNGRRITGHTARLGGPGLWSYLAAGVGDDHNAVTADEVLERVRLGAMLTVMAGSMNDNTESVFADLDAIRPALGHMCFCADDKHVLDLATQGHIDHHVRQAIRFGVEPATAYRMASWQPALYYRLDQHIGSIAPGRLADLQLIPDLAEVWPDLVLVGGKTVARGGTALFQDVDDVPAWTRDTMSIPAGFPAESLAVPAAGRTGTPGGATAWVQAMEMYDGYFKRAFHVELPVVDGEVQPDVSLDVLKIAVVDRHHGDGLTGTGFVRGFGLDRGAMLITNNCFNMNLVVLGTNDRDMAAAVRRARETGGCFLVVRDEVVLAQVDLPIGGMMADGPWERTRDQLAAAHDVLAGLGCTIASPFMILSFVGLGGVPDLGLTELGLIEASSQSFTDLVLSTDDTGRPACRCPSHAYPVHRLADPGTAS